MNNTENSDLPVPISQAETEIRFFHCRSTDKLAHVFLPIIWLNEVRCSSCDIEKLKVILIKFFQCWINGHTMMIHMYCNSFL